MRPLLLLLLVFRGRAATDAETAPEPVCHSDSFLQVGSRRPEAPGGRDHVAERRQLAHRMMEGEDPPDYAEVQSYAVHYHARLSASRMILYQHVSKSAGTMLCEVARHNGCRTALDNCHVDPQDGPAWLQVPTDPLSCSSQAQVYELKNLTFEGNEKYRFCPHLCHEFWNVLIMREPKMRLMSQLFHLRRLTGSGSGWDHPSLSRVMGNASRTTRPNYYIRTLLGKMGFDPSLESMDESHLERAWAILTGYDVLLVMDERNKTSLEERIRATLGFAFPEEVERRDRDTENYTDHHLGWSPRDWEALDAANALDSELWRRAQALSAMDDRVFAHPAFSDFSARMPRGPCGYLAK